MMSFHMAPASRILKLRAPEMGSSRHHSQLTLYTNTICLISYNLLYQKNYESSSSAAALHLEGSGFKTGDRRL